MRQSHRGASQLTPASQTVVAARICAFLRRLHPHKTADCVSVDAGIPAGTVQKWLDRGSAPSAYAVFRLIGAYGPDFACAVFTSAPDWLSRAAREEEAKRLRAEIAILEARLQGARS